MNPLMLTSPMCVLAERAESSAGMLEDEGVDTLIEWLNTVSPTSILGPSPCDRSAGDTTVDTGALDGAEDSADGGADGSADDDAEIGAEIGVVAGIDVGAEMGTEVASDVGAEATKNEVACAGMLVGPMRLASEVAGMAT